MWDYCAAHWVISAAHPVFFCGRMHAAYHRVMRKPYCGAAALLLGVSCLCGQTLGPQQFSQDLQSVVTQLPKLHVNLFFQISQADFQAAAQQLQADLPGLTQYQFYTRLSMLVAMARDGHTSLELSPSAGFRQLPVTLQNFADGYFVTAASADQPSLNRAKLVAVGTTPIDQVLAALEPVISHENEYWFRALAAQGLTDLGVMRGLGFLPNSGAANYTFQLDSGNQVTVDLSTLQAAQVRALDSPAGFIPPLLISPASYWSVYWAGTRTVWVRLASFHSPDGGQQEATYALALLDSNPVDNLVFDLRDDGGGDLTVAFPLLQGVTQRLAALQGNPAFRVSALINGGSYSSAAVLAMILKGGVPDFLAPYAPGIGMIPTTLVGEPTGGPPLTHGNPLTFTLPASKMLVQYSTVYSPAFPNIPSGDALYPDVSAPVQSTDYFARHDAIVGAVLARAGVPPAAPAGDAIVVNAASFRLQSGVAPGSLAAAFGTFPAGGVSVLVNGEAAQVTASSSSQAVFLVPGDAAAGPAHVEVQQNGSTVASGTFTVTAAGPGLFVNAPVSAQPGDILNQDFSPNSSTAPAAKGSVLVIYGTGYGPLNGAGQAAVSVWVAGVPAEVLYSGPVAGAPGLWQINVQVPNDGAVAGQVPVFVSALGLVSNGVTAWVQP
jgi:uncharacterized protein (TIGR03437 family)